MTAQTLPDEPNFCFCPAYDVETEVQQIRIVIEGLAGHVPTALVSLDLENALDICDKLNRRLGLDRAFGPGYPLQSPVAGAPCDFRFYPYRLRSLRSLRASLGRDGCQAGGSLPRPCRAATPMGAVQVERIGHPT